MLANNSVCIIDGKRTPFGKFYGAFRDIPAPMLAAYILRTFSEQLAEEYGINREHNIHQVILGNVIQAGIGQNPARQAALAAGLSVGTSALTVNKVCSSGLLSVKLAAQAIACDDADIIAAGGMENMSLAPYFIKRPQKKVYGDVLFSSANTYFDFGAEEIVRDGLSDGLHDAYGNGAMGRIGELCAKVSRISREAQDAYAYESYRRAFHAIDDPAFYEQIESGDMPIVRDEEIHEPDLQRMQSLSPVFESSRGTITAANASKLSDGAAILLLASSAFAEWIGMRTLARISAFAEYSDEPKLFPTAPTYAIKKVLQQANLPVTAIDLFEINEAFALVPIYAMRELSIPHDKVNIWGGAISVGHPLGASGARILMNLVYALRAKGKKRGIAALCNGGGEAVAVLVEVDD